MKRPSYRTAIELLALNDDPGEMDEESVARSVSVGIVASLFEVEAERVARDVVRFRKSEPIYPFGRRVVPEAFEPGGVNAIRSHPEPDPIDVAVDEAIAKVREEAGGR